MSHLTDIIVVMLAISSVLVHQALSCFEAYAIHVPSIWNTLLLNPFIESVFLVGWLFFLEKPYCTF